MSGDAHSTPTNLPAGVPYYLHVQFNWDQHGSGGSINEWQQALAERITLPYSTHWYIGLVQATCTRPNARPLAPDTFHILCKEAATPFNHGGCIGAFAIRSSNDVKVDRSNVHHYEPPTIAYHLLKLSELTHLNFKVVRNLGERFEDKPLPPIEDGVNLYLCLAITKMKPSGRTEDIPMTVGNFASLQTLYPHNSTSRFTFRLPDNLSVAHRANWYLGLRSIMLPTHYLIAGDECETSVFEMVLVVTSELKSLKLIRAAFDNNLPFERASPHELESGSYAYEMRWQFGVEKEVTKWQTYHDIFAAVQQKLRTANGLFIVNQNPMNPAKWTASINAYKFKGVVQDVQLKMSRKLANLLGVDKQREGSAVVSVYPLSYWRTYKNYTMNPKFFVPDCAYIYCDVVEASIIGSRMKKLLASVPITLGVGFDKPVLTTHESHCFANILFHRMTHNAADHIEFIVGDENGTPFCFRPGKDGKPLTTTMEVILRVEV